MQGLRDKVLEFDDIDELPALLLARQLYMLKCTRELSVKEKLELNRRFAKGLMMLRTSPHHKEIHDKVCEFVRFIKEKGISVRSKDSSSNKVELWLNWLVCGVKCAFWGLIVSIMRFSFCQDCCSGEELLGLLAIWLNKTDGTGRNCLRSSSTASTWWPPKRSSCRPS
jgi:hypothetical protein